MHISYSALIKLLGTSVQNLRFLGDARIRSTPNSGKGTFTDLFELLISKFSSQKLYESLDST